MLFVSDYDEIVGIDRILIIAFSIAAIISAWVIAGIMFRKMKKSNMKTVKLFHFGIFAFAILFGLGRAILLYHDYYANDIFDEVLWRWANTASLGGLVCLITSIETQVSNKTKHSITVGGIIGLLFFILLDKQSATVILYICAITLTILPLLIYIYIARSTTGNVRQQAIQIIIGMLLLLLSMLGTALLFNFSVISRTISQILAFSLVIVSMVFLVRGFLQGPSK
jgi:hypothetical protein